MAFTLANAPSIPPSGWGSFLLWTDMRAGFKNTHTHNQAHYFRQTNHGKLPVAQIWPNRHTHTETPNLPVSVLFGVVDAAGPL